MGRELLGERGEVDDVSVEDTDIAVALNKEILELRNLSLMSVIISHLDHQTPLHLVKRNVLI